MQNRAAIQLAVLTSISAISCLVLYAVFYRKHQEDEQQEAQQKTIGGDNASPATLEKTLDEEKPVATTEKTLKTQEYTEPTTATAVGGQDAATAATKKYKAGEYTEAISLYGVAISQCKASDTVDQRNLKVMYSNRAAAYEKLSDWENVIADCTNALGIDKRHPKAYLRRAKAKAASGDNIGALVDYVCLLVLSEQKGEQVDEKLGVDITKVHSEVTAQYVKEALVKCEQDLSKRFLPDTFFVTSYYSSFHADDAENDILGDKDVSECCKELQALGESSDTRVQRVELLVKRALGYIKLAKYEEASNDLDVACSLVEKGDLAYYTAHIENGTFHHLRGHFTKAKESFEAALAVKPQSIYAKVRMGGLCFDQKDLEGALNWFDKALLDKPKSSTAYFHRGQLRSIDVSQDASGKMPEGVQDLERCIELAPDFTMAYIQLGVTHARLGAFDRAIEYLKLARELSPNVPEIYNYLGETYMQMIQIPGSGMDLQTVEEMFEKAIQIDPTYPMAYINHGNVLMQKGSQYGHQALGLFETAVLMCPRSKLAFCHLAQVYMAMQEYPRALEQIDHALRLAFTEEELTELFGLRITAETHQKAKLLL